MLRLVALAALLLGSPPPNPPQDGKPPELVAKTEALSPQDERRALHVPDGFEIQLVASEPEIHKPMNLAFDDRGRLWVTSTVEYPYPAAPGTTPRDKVLILDDFASDGRARKVSTFAEGLNIPIGVLPLGRGDRALVHAIPAIRLLTDSDGDGKADQSREMYATYGSRDTHGMTNAFTWGFDGWIYACHGFSNESKVIGSDGKPIVMQSGNVYRMKPDGSHLEYVTHGQVNPFGLAFDPLGNLYSSDCHSRPIYNLLPGAYYPSFGKPNDGLGFGPEMMQHDHGSTGIAGIVRYAADAFPKEYEGSIFIGNVVTSRVNLDRVVWTGASPKAIPQADFVASDDPWFRPVDIKLGPDGALYIADFYNRIIGHYEVPLTHPGRDRERGRIWRVVPKGKLVKAPRADWTKATDAELVADLGHPNLTVRTKAANNLVDRGASVVDRVRASANADDPTTKLHALWVLHRLGAIDEPAVVEATRASSALVRVHAQRILGERESLGEGGRSAAVSGLADPDPFVRKGAAEALGRHPSASNLRPLLDAVAKVDRADTHLTHVLRMALRDQLRPLEAWAEVARTAWSDADRAALADVALGVPTLDSARFLARTLGGTKLEGRGVEIAHQIARHGNPETEAALLVAIRSDRLGGSGGEIIKAMAQGAQEAGRPLGPEAQTLAAELTSRLLQAPNPAEVKRGIELAGTLKLASMRGPLATFLKDQGRRADQRSSAIAALVAVDPVGAVADLASIVTDARSPIELREQAATALNGTGRDEAREALLGALPTAPGRLQTSIAIALASTAPGAEALLGAVGQGKASARLLQERSVEVRLSLLNLPGFRDRLALLLKGLPPADRKLQASIDARRSAFASARPDLEAGSALFQKHCAACHQLEGKGARIGPQLDGIGVRGVDRLLEDVLDPNRNVDQAFRTTSLALDGGQVVSGLLLREEGEVLVLADSQGKEVRVPKTSVEERTTSQLSPMPANLSDQVNESEFVHLLGYLLSKRPPKD